MPKFYVQCGHVDLILNADSRESAALAIIDRVLSPHLWVYDDPGLSEFDCRQHLVLEALLHLPTEIRVSERGFCCDDAMADDGTIAVQNVESCTVESCTVESCTTVAVPEIIQKWHALMVGMRRLFAQAGLSRSISVLASSGAIEQTVGIRRSPK